MQELLDVKSLKNLVHQPSLSNTDRLLLCLSLGADKPKSIQDIKAIAESIGLSRAKGLNISSYLVKSKGLAIRTDKGWELTEGGKRRIANIAGAPVPHIAGSLRSYLKGISNNDTQAFVEEAIRCYEFKMYRVAVVLSWVGAVSLIYDFVINNKLADFNTEAKKRDPKWKDAKKKDDICKMKEYDFL